MARAIAPRYAFAATLALNLNLTAIITAPVRYESWIITFVLLGLLAHRRRRYLWATFFWSIGCGLKWYPAFFIAAQEWRLIVVDRRRWHWAGATAVFLGVTAALNLPFALLDLSHTGTLDNWLWPYLFHMRRPLYWDTLLGVGQIWLGALPWERYAGLWSLGLMLLAVTVRPRMGIEYKGVLVCLAGIVFNRIYSTQFNLWFYPFLILGILADDDERRRRALVWSFVVMDLLNVIVYPLSFAGAVAEMGGFFPGAAREGGGASTVVFSAAIVLRTVVVILIAAVLLRPSPGNGGQRSAATAQ